MEDKTIIIDFETVLNEITADLNNVKKYSKTVDIERLLEQIEELRINHMQVYNNDGSLDDLPF